MTLSFENGHLNQADRAIYCVFLHVTKCSHMPTGTMTAVDIVTNDIILLICCVLAKYNRLLFRIFNVCGGSLCAQVVAEMGVPT